MRSTEYHANILSIDTSEAEKMPGVVGFLRAADIKGTNRLRQVVPDQPVLCEDRVRLLGDPIIAVAANTREQARAAAAAVKVLYEPLPVQMTPAESLAPGAFVLHAHAPDNICCTQPLIKGDAEAALKEAVYVYEGNTPPKPTIRRRWNRKFLQRILKVKARHRNWWWSDAVSTFIFI